MIELIDNCVDCGLPCIYSACPYYKRDYVCCDVCHEPIRPAEEEDYSCIEYVCDTCYEKIHPTQKPVVLYEWILRQYGKYINGHKRKILDTHVGSGSSLIAYEKHGY